MNSKYSCQLNIVAHEVQHLRAVRDNREFQERQQTAAFTVQHFAISVRIRMSYVLTNLYYPSWKNSDPFDWCIHCFFFTTIATQRYTGVSLKNTVNMTLLLRFKENVWVRRALWKAVFSRLQSSTCQVARWEFSIDFPTALSHGLTLAFSRN